MKRQELNVFMIENLKDLNCEYRLYRVRGLSNNSAEYHNNKQQLINILRNKTHSPLVPMVQNGKSFIAQLEGFRDLPDYESLIRASVKIEKLDKHTLNLSKLDNDSFPLAEKFLSWELQSKFFNNIDLWQPSSGYPFYHKLHDKKFRELSDKIDLFKGFSFRIIKINNEIGICIDVNRKYISQLYLPFYISKEDFKKGYMNNKCLYEYGKDWYEIKLKGRNELKLNQISLAQTNQTLYENVVSKPKKYNTHIINSLPEDSTTLYYFQYGKFQKNVPSGLCRLTYKTNHPEVKKFHHLTIINPKRRRDEILKIYKRFFNNLTFGREKIILSKSPFIIQEKRFNIPDLRFGGEKILSLINNGSNTIKVKANQFGRTKQSLLLNEDVGLLTYKKFDYQYLILPRSILNTYGKRFSEDLKTYLDCLYFDGKKVDYSPKIIYYNDQIQQSVYRIGKEITNTIDHDCKYPGYGVVMIPRIKYSKNRKEDELANYIMIEARKKHIFLSIIHKNLSERSYRKTTVKGEDVWKISKNKTIQKKFKGYLRNVVLNKILILNHFWPFILESNLNADLIIGIDVKNNTAGFTFINKTTDLIFFKESESSNKEQLSTTQVYSEIYNNIKNEPNFEDIKEIVIHRHGKIFPSEEMGIKKAIIALEKEGIISPNYRLTIVEIRTTSRLPFRHFEIKYDKQKNKIFVLNPKIGTYCLLGSDEAFLCTTGFPYKIRGTIKPLHVFKYGSQSIESVLRDVFYLSNLTYTKVDYCLRLPFSVKLNDIRLREIAGDYDYDEFKFNG